MSVIKYAIADDHKIFRQGLQYALADDEELAFMGEADNGIMLLELLEKQQPDVVLLDLKMPGMDGIETTKKMHSLYPDIKILILTTYDNEHFILHLLELGANGYLLKNAEPAEIKKAIHAVYEREHYFNNLVNSTMLKTITQKRKVNIKSNEDISLTSREIEVLKMICKEMTTTEIANEIFLSKRTIEGIRTTLIEKTGVRNMAGLVLYAMKYDLIDN